MKAIQLFEGDMIITTAQQQAAQQGQDLISAAAVRGASKQYLWPGGIVHYSIEQQLSNLLNVSILKLFRKPMAWTLNQTYNTHFFFPILLLSGIWKKLLRDQITIVAILPNLSEDDPLSLEAIVKGMKQWSRATCITFKERTDEKAFIYFFIGGRYSQNIFCVYYAVSVSFYVANNFCGW